MATTIDDITQTITTIPTAGHRGVDNRDVFVTKQEAFQDTLTATTVTELNTLKTQINTTTGQINTVAGEVATNATNADDSADIALQAKTDIENILATLPDGTINDLLTELTNTWSASKINSELSGKASSSDLALKLNATNPLITGSITESVYNLTGTGINPANGTIQYKTVSANTTFTESLTSGQSLALRLVNASLYTITFPPITWFGVAPTSLTSNCQFVIWKEGTTLHGSYSGGAV